MADEVDSTISFTAGETKLITSMMKNLQGDFPCDFDAVAKECGYKDAQIAKQRWGQIKRKKITNAAPLGGVDKKTPSKKAAVKPKKATRDGDDEEEDFKSPPKTPSKRTRKPRVKVEAKEDDDDEAAAAEKEDNDGEEDA